MHQVGPFSGDTVEVTVTVSSYSGGDGEFKLYDSNNGVVSSSVLRIPVPQAVVVPQRPYYFSIGFNDWTSEASVKAVGR